MKKDLILSMPFSGGEARFDSNQGSLTPLEKPCDGKISGVVDQCGEYAVALFVEDGQLYLQVGANRWLFSHDELVINYSHLIADKVTEFKVVGQSKESIILRPAWWAEIPGFELFEPEMDEDEDFLGYIYGIFNRPSAWGYLLKSWS